MMINITYPNLLNGCNSFVFSAWIINEFEDNEWQIIETPGLLFFSDFDE